MEEDENPGQDAALEQLDPNVSSKRKLSASESSQPGQIGNNGGNDGGEDYQQLKRRRKIEPRGVPWFVMLERLKQYRERYGSLNVPSTFRQVRAGCGGVPIYYVLDL